MRNINWENGDIFVTVALIGFSPVKLVLTANTFIIRGFTMDNKYLFY